MRVIFAKFLLLSKIQTLSHKPLVRQTSNNHHCNWHAQKPSCRDFQVMLSSPSGQNQLCLYIFKEQIWLPNCLLLKIVESAHMPELKEVKMYS